MIGLDTNVVVRYLMQDDPRQSRQATAVLESLSSDDPAYVTLVTVVEIVWVLESGYDLNCEQVSKAIAGLLAARELRIDRAQNVIQALRVYQRGRVDFADALIERLSAEAGCEHTLTFDVRAAKEGGMKLVG
jgi:predicted nucleic-acid-binding protein